MKKIKLYEEFTDSTLSRNNTKYDTYLSSPNRSNIVAWESHGSQTKNFKLAINHIQNGNSILDYGCGIGDFIEYLIKHDIEISDYLGVDINDNFIKLAKETYPNHNFKTIKDINQIKGKWDVVCAIGVFTWYITKEEFIKSIHQLYNLCNKQLILTLLEGDTPYNPNVKYDTEDEYWDGDYRYYDESLFNELFPELNISYEYKGTTILIKIEK